MKTIAKLWILIAVLIILSPLGLIIPKYFKGGAAWGEWDIDEIREMIGYVPSGLARFASLWKAPLADYNPSYILSAAAGILCVAGIVFLIGKFITRK